MDYNNLLLNLDILDIHYCQTPCPYPLLPHSGVVHLSDYRGPLPEAETGNEDESSESTLTEANNGVPKPNPAQVNQLDLFLMDERHAR